MFVPQPVYNCAIEQDFIFPAVLVAAAFAPTVPHLPAVPVETAPHVPSVLFILQTQLISKRVPRMAVAYVDIRTS